MKEEKKWIYQMTTLDFIFCQRWKEIKFIFVICTSHEFVMNIVSLLAHNIIHSC